MWKDISKLFMVGAAKLASSPTVKHGAANVLEKTGETVLPVAGAAAKFVAPGVVGGVAGGVIGKCVGDTPEEKKIIGTFTGGVLGATAGCITEGPVGGLVNGLVGAGTGHLVASL